MAKVKITLDTRSTSQDKDGKYPLVLRISHKSKTRDIPFDIHLARENFIEIEDEDGKKKTAYFEIKGVTNAVRKTKRVQKTYSDVDLWMDDNKGEIKLWDIAKLKDTIERKFFKKQNELSLLSHGGQYIKRLWLEGRYPTASSYHDALKAFVKYQINLTGGNDKVIVKSLFTENAKQIIENKKHQGGLTVNEEYQKYDNLTPAQENLMRVTIF